MCAAVRTFMGSPVRFVDPGRLKLWQACGHVIKSGNARYTHARHSLRLGPRVLCSLDPNWQATSKTFSSLTESVKVRMAAT